MALLPAFSHLLHSNSTGGGLTGTAAVGVMIYGVWGYGLTSFRRWAIAALPFVTAFLLVLMFMILMVPFFSDGPLVPGDQPVVSRVNQAAALLAAMLLAVALWRMRGKDFREYNKAALGMK